MSEKAAKQPTKLLALGGVRLCLQRKCEPPEHEEELRGRLGNIKGTITSMVSKGIAALIFIEMWAY